MAGVTQLTLRHDEAAYVAGHLRRLVSWEPEAAVRVRVAGSTLGIFGLPPLDCMSFVAVPLAADSDASIVSERADANVETVDTVVSAGRMRDVIGDVSGKGAGAHRTIRLPDSLGPVAGLAVLPPTGPWLPAERGIAGDVRRIVADGVREFRERNEALGQSTARVLDELAQELWSRPGWGGVPLRALHAANLLGMLPHDGLRIETATCEGWKRLLTPVGQVFVRSSGLPPKLSLAVLR
jgi:hypothetical protein